LGEREREREGEREREKERERKKERKREREKERECCARETKNHQVVENPAELLMERVIVPFARTCSQDWNCLKEMRASLRTRAREKERERERDASRSFRIQSFDFLSE